VAPFPPNRSDIELSVVVPVYNESPNIGPLCDRAAPVLERITPAWEILFVDDGSTDGTLAAVKTRNAQDPRIKAVAFSRNFGKEVAIAAGLDHAAGARSSSWTPICSTLPN
jgi:glycosyltransferase involved in cell wall biosynthesis